MPNVPKIKVTPPGKEAKRIIALDDKYLATSTKTSPVVARRGKGVSVEDVDGNIYLDFTSGIGVLNTGHCHPGVVKAVQHQAGELMHFAGTDFYYEIQTVLAKRLTEITPGKHPKKVFFTNSGTESIEAAIKLAKWSTQRKQFIAFLGAFHGRTTGAGALTASRTVQRERFFPLMPGVTHLPYAYCYRCAYRMTYPDCDLWCAKILEETYFSTLLPPQEVAALFVEPIQGEGGYVVPPQGYLAELKRIAERHGFLFVDDEVQAGFARTGRMFAIGHFGVVPDIIALAKGMGSGMPLGACVFRAELDFGVKGAHSNTYGGNLVACASALATIEVILKEKLMKNAERMGKVLSKRLQELHERYEMVGDRRGIGLMQVVEYVKNRRTKSYATDYRDRVIELAYKNGLLLLPCGRSCIRLIPPLIVNEEQIHAGIDILERCMARAGD